MSRLYRIGSLAVDTETGVKCLSFKANSGNYDTCEFPIGTNYQVPAGKTLYITKILYMNKSAGGNFSFGYGDDAVTDDVNPPTNFVTSTTVIYADVANKEFELSVFIPIPANKYPCIRASFGDSRIIIFGVEV